MHVSSVKHQKYGADAHLKDYREVTYEKEQELRYTPRSSNESMQCQLEEADNPSKKLTAR